MPNTSASGGNLVPLDAPAPVEDDALDNVLQALIVAATGLPGNLVRPRWQVKPPKQPDVSVDWCAIGIVSSTPDAGPAIVHDGNAAGGLGQDTYARHEDIEVLASFYGPNSGKFAGLARDGITIPQNLEILQSSLMTFINSDTIRQVPEIFNEQWIKRRDMPLHFRRKVERVYQVENIVSADVASFDTADFRITTS